MNIPKIIDKIQVKHRPRSFDEEVVKDLNDEFVPQLDKLFCKYEEGFFKYEQALSDIHNVLSDSLDSYN